MSNYAPASSLGWLDFDAAASAAVAELIRALEEPATLDNLGLGAVRDAFSAQLSPGTSTLQTRLRYFIFVPWIFARLEEQRVAPGDFARRLRDDEARLIDCLRHLGPNNGVIGYKAGRDLKYMPSWLYWLGLGSWGLRRGNLSISESGQRAAALARQQPERDDDHNATAPLTAMWAPLPPPPADFLHAPIDFELSAEEAQALIDSIRRNLPGTFLAALCEAPAVAAGAPWPWDVPTDSLSGEIIALLRHARCFSELTLGPQLVYNLLLARRAHAEFGWDTRGLAERQLGRLASWAETVARRHEELGAWVEDRAEFWDVVGVGNKRTREFIDTVVRLAVEDPDGFAENEAVHYCITQRELRLKGRRARLSHRSALENWNRTESGGQLDYRWWVTKRHLADLAAALGATAR